MIEPTKSDLGRAVIYKTAGSPAERGVITSISRLSREYVFVRYGVDLHAKATHVATLSWDTEP